MSSFWKKLQRLWPSRSRGRDPAITDADAARRAKAAGDGGVGVASSPIKRVATAAISRSIAGTSTHTKPSTKGLEVTNSSSSPARPANRQPRSERKASSVAERAKNRPPDARPVAQWLAIAPADHEASARLQSRIALLAEEIEKEQSLNAASASPDFDDLSDLSNRLSAGTRLSVETPRRTSPVDAILGVDFGTSCTKIVARLPYEPGEPAIAIPVPSFARAESHDNLWQSRLWLSPDGQLSINPRESAGVICGLKASLLRPLSDRRLVLNVGQASITGLEAATAFLALQIRQARGWLLDNRADLFGRGPLRWTINVGFPAASLDKSEMRSRYTTALKAAAALSCLPGDLTAPTVRGVITSMAHSSVLRDPIELNLVPEIAAAVAGFANSRRREDGLYVMIDVGAGTVDCCSFNLFSRDDEDRCAIFVADVSMLGVQPWQLCQNDAELSGFFRSVLELHEKAIIWETKKRRFTTSDRWQRGLPIFLVGGGSASQIHRQTALSLDTWLKQYGQEGSRILALPPPEGFTYQCDRQTVHRLSVAVGLSLPFVDIPKVMLPHSIDDQLSPRRIVDDPYISKDMM